MKKYGQLELKNGIWHVTAEPHVMIKLKAIIGRVSKSQFGTVTILNNPEICRDLEWFTERYPLDVVHEKELKAGADFYRKTLADLESIGNPNYVPNTYELAKPLRHYQAVAVDLFLKRGIILNADMLGLGKSITAIGSLTQKQTLPALIVCNSHLETQWKNYIHEFLPMANAHIIYKKKHYHLPAADVYIISYSKLAAWTQVLGKFVKSITYDECLTGDSKVALWPPERGSVSISEITPGEKITSFDSSGCLHSDIVISKTGKGKREVWKITLENGNNISCTANELIRLENKWVYMRDIIIGRTSREFRVCCLPQGEIPRLETSKIISIENLGFKEVWDIETEKNHTFFANGIAVHNCQELRHEGSLKHKAAVYLTNFAQYIQGLSATPIFNYGGEIFNIFQALRPGVLGTRDEFIREWCIVGRHVLLKDSEAFGSYLRDNHLMVRRTRQEVGRELPPLQTIVHEIEYDQKALDAIDDIATELANRILKGTFHEQGEAAREFDMRLRQATGVAKAPFAAAFVNMLVDGGEKVILSGWHRDVYDVLNAKINPEYKPVMFTGSESPKQKQESIDKFVNGDSKVFIISLRSGAGLDGLQKVCNVVVHAELDWSPQVHDQLTGRSFRDGQEKPVTEFYLVTNGGSDPIVVDVLGVKKSQSKGLLDPGLPGIKQTGDNSARIKMLAKAYLKRHKVKK